MHAFGALILPIGIRLIHKSCLRAGPYQSIRDMGHDNTDTKTPQKHLAPHLSEHGKQFALGFPAFLAQDDGHEQCRSNDCKFTPAHAHCCVVRIIMSFTKQVSLFAHAPCHDMLMYPRARVDTLDADPLPLVKSVQLLQ